MPVYIGRVWSDGDPFLLLDAADGPAWSPSRDDYEALVEQLADQKTELTVGEGNAFVLAHEAGEGELEVFRDDDRLLAVIARYADEGFDDLAAMASGTGLQEAVAIDVRSGELAIVRAAVPWTEATEEDTLVVPVAPGRYQVSEGQLDEDRFGIDVWRIAR